MLAIVAVGSVVWLRSFDYSTSLLTWRTADEALQADGAVLGPVTWDLDTYASAESLAPFRDFVGEHCPALSPPETARCVALLFAERFDHEAPAREFFDPAYDPAADLAAHLAGAGGHCVTRSGLIATMLLSRGMLARVAQLRPLGGTGHNVVEVWDPHDGWAVIDPTYGGELRSAGAIEMLATGARATWDWRSTGGPATLAHLGVHERDESAQTWFTGHIVYPDPWLYTRTGSGVAWPFRGRFVVVGPPSWALFFGPRTAFLLALCAVCLLAVDLGTGLRAAIRRRRRVSTR